MKRNSKQFLALFMAVAMSVTPVSYAYAEDSAVAGVENTESGQQTVEVTDGKIGAADAAGQPAEEVTGQEEETTAGQGTDEKQKSQEEPKAEENAETGNVTEAEKKEAGEDGKSEEKISERQDVKTEETAQNAGEVNTQEAKNVTSDFTKFKVGSSSVVKENDHLKVSIETEDTTYNKIYIGSKADTVERKEEKAIVGTGTGNGYLFSFELPLSADGTDVAFVPHSQKKGWVSKKEDGDYTLHISSSAENKKDDTENPEQGGNLGESKPETGSGENQKPGNEDKNVLDTGKYVVDVDAASACGMFRVGNCVLTSVGGKMQADITLSETGYDYLYVGTVKDAEKASKDQLIAPKEIVEGKCVFTVPVESVNTGIQIAAHGEESGKWFDCTLTFKTEGMTKYVQVSDGSYKANVTSSSSMFKVTDCILTSKNGEMTAKITLSGTGYDYLYVGTSAEAAADKSKWIPYVVDKNGMYTYTIPVSLLDTGISVAAFSHKKQVWYDRTLTFASAGMKNLNNSNSTNGTTGNNGNTNQGNNTSQNTNFGTGTTSGGTGTNQTPDKESKYEADLNGGTARVNSATALADGVYTPDKFSWSGGTGKVSISCTKITVTGGQAYATIVFSSGSYGYVKANGNTYYPTATGSTSTFVIPVELNKNNTIIGMTTKMSTAHEISYSIFIYLSVAAKADGTTVSGETNLSADTLDEKAPEIMGLSYQSETKVEHAKYFKIYHYDQGITLLEIDQRKDEDTKETKTKDTKEDTDSGLTPAQEEQLALYKAKIVRYLIVPEDAEIPAGLDKEMIVIQKPKKSAYVGSEEVLEILDKLNATDQITSVGVKLKNCKVEGIAKAMKAKKIIYAGTYKKPENKKLMKSKCDLAILSNKILPDEKNKKKMSVEDQQKRYEELAEKFVLLDIPMIVDRSADEEKDDAKEEWSKVYEAIFAQTDSADSSAIN
ncbi:putative sodium/potassium/calcium exchanger [Coprococcus comes]|uniref:Uncharacterized protein n=1 Tax=Coprococcus comes TaxID=410072 RepID=A0A3R6HCA1_9FIRM|nr:hypothetical protein [Coprococcus comes]RHG61513.1 hypothetical protein DW252_04285 [Coprococcus comes]